MLGMEQMYKMALDPRIYPDSRLLSIMQGRDQSLPMAIAMAAKQQRDKLHTAGQGQEAQQGAKQPTIKDQMLARDLPPEHSGLGMLPAENMQGMDEVHMAGGGIIAFANTGSVPAPEGDIKLESDEDKQSKKDRSDLKYGWEHTKAAARDILTLPGRGIAGAFETAVTRPVRAMGIDMPYLPASFYGGDASSLTPHMDQLRRAEAAAAPQTGATTPTINNTPTAAELATLQKGGPQAGGLTKEQQDVINAKNANNPIKTGGVGTPPAAAPVANQDQGIAGLAKRPDRYAGLGETQEAFDKKITGEKNAAQGEFLMNIGLKMMTTVGPIGKAVGEGGLAGLPGLTASRKTINELEKNRKDYQLNMAKYQTAADEGDQELAFKYKHLAEQSVYHAGLVTADMMKARAYSAGVGSKEDMADQRRETSIMGIAKGLLEKNMKYNMPNTKPEERQAMEQAAINSAVNMYNNAKTATKGSAGFKLLGVEQQG
jgi:hypothetical protein